MQIFSETPGGFAALSSDTRSLALEGVQRPWLSERSEVTGCLPESLKPHPYQGKREGVRP
jgi:hypothetical protein